MGAVFEVVGVRGIGGGCNVAELGSINGGMKRPCHLKKKKKEKETDGGKGFFLFFG